MTVNVEVDPREEAWLSAKAAEQGLPAAEIIKQLIDAQLPEAPQESETAPHLDAKTLAAIAMLDAWIEEGKKASPEERRLAEEELAELKRNMNANREATGE